MAIAEEVKSRVLDALTHRVQPRFANKGKRWQAAAARKIGVHPSTINRLLKGDTVPEYEFIEKLARYLDELPESFFVAPSGHAVPMLRALAGYKAALAAAKKRADEEGRLIEPWAWEKAGDTRAVPVPPEIRPAFLLELAATYMRSGDGVR